MRFLLLTLLVGCGPVWMFPGGRLAGSEASTPMTAWQTLDHCKVIQLETRAADPYSINIWAAGSGAQLYLASGAGAKSPWVQLIQTDPRVRVQACDTVYRMRAAHTADEQELEHFLEAVARKYDWKREQALEYKEWVFRLDPL